MKGFLLRLKKNIFWMNLGKRMYPLMGFIISAGIIIQAVLLVYCGQKKKYSVPFFARSISEGFRSLYL